jgi:hypothetical protein
MVIKTLVMIKSVRPVNLVQVDKNYLRIYLFDSIVSAANCSSFRSCRISKTKESWWLQEIILIKQVLFYKMIQLTNRTGKNHKMRLIAMFWLCYWVHGNEGIFANLAFTLPHWPDGTLNAVIKSVCRQLQDRWSVMVKSEWKITENVTRLTYYVVLSYISMVETAAIICVIFNYSAHDVTSKIRFSNNFVI